MPKKRTKPPTEAAPVASYKHKDKRARIPTQEESVKLPSREKQPVKKKYDYDPSLEPQLVWAGKKEAGAEFAVPTVPIYVQEKVAPEAIIARLKSGVNESLQTMLFGETAELQFRKAVEFYKHEDNWQNRMILGDSLLVMNSLLEKEGMRGRVQTIYIDPPYGIKFGSNWQTSTRKREVKDNKVDDLVRQPEQIKAFRDTWELGIHSYLSYLRDRLIVARELLTESGSCFIQISNENIHHIRELMDEVFGTINECGMIIYQRTSAQTSELIPVVSDYIIWYAKDIERVKYRQLYESKDFRDDQNYRWIELEDGTRSRASIEEIEESIVKKRAKVFRLDQTTSQTGSDNSRFTYEFNGKSFKPAGSRGWSTTKDGLDKLKSLKR